MDDAMKKINCWNCKKDFSIPINENLKNILFRFCDKCLQSADGNHPLGVRLDDHMNSVGTLLIKVGAAPEKVGSIEGFAVMEMLNSLQKQIDFLREKLTPPL